ncbi:MULTISPECIES: DUF732 domain-containing protein [Mycobacterium avium complex (MAC)]|uniref:DUF732 domain-containing protein n=1 Tax=Mycobacterium indicus pranii (strain DSM 45239 / MTCC 9506) TaxID=1232724 RepID=J9WBW0_MYCIP|nr:MULTISPECIES: DUF732 domain-containing protein [Mycobacterium avium complex (MAC)]AFS13653.1 Hypothetical protein MIP_02414 [Mycobacterium intracellulare subsp. intracellulare MTCC 9506]BCO51226.1 hypothetical protein MINTM003_16670 [Mycobacterium paraintracellulare]BCO88412.1 hypothetical protein MINTM015_16690 [Mycobacterium paraintracellulare]
MLRTFGLAAASAATVVVIASCSHEPSPDQGFLDAVHAAGMHADDGDQKLLGLGHEVCHRLDVGETVQQVTDEVWAGMPHRPLVDQRSPSEFQSDAKQHQTASDFVGDALNYLCPEQASHYHGR